jgi:hypothetical protein
MYFHYIVQIRCPCSDNKNREGKMTQLNKLAARPIKAVALVSAAAMVLVGCAAADEEQETATPTASETQEPATVGGNMVVGITVDPDTIFPMQI